MKLILAANLLSHGCIKCKLQYSCIIINIEIWTRTNNNLASHDDCWWYNLLRPQNPISGGRLTTWSWWNHILYPIWILLTRRDPTRRYYPRNYATQPDFTILSGFAMYPSWTASGGDVVSPDSQPLVYGTMHITGGGSALLQNSICHLTSDA